jgi:hypothetical protein
MRFHSDIAVSTKILLKETLKINHNKLVCICICVSIGPENVQTSGVADERKYMSNPISEFPNFLLWNSFLLR